MHIIHIYLLNFIHGYNVWKKYVEEVDVNILSRNNMLQVNIKSKRISLWQIS